MTGRDDAALRDVLAAGAAVLSYTKRGKRAFMQDPILQDAVVRRFEVMGEAAKRLSPAFRAANGEIPWKRIAGFRDVLIHGYDLVRPEEVWAIVDGELPKVVAALRRLAKP